MESSDDPHEADLPVEERPGPHANRARKHELGDVTPRPPLRVFASSEKVLATPPPLPSHHSAPSVLLSAAVSVPPCISAPSEPVPIVAMASPTPAPAATVPGPHIDTSPAPRALVRFHEESFLCPYPRAPVDDRDDIVELDFADTSALSDVDAFERRRLNGRNGAKHSKKDRARERDEIERSWNVPGKSITPNLNPVCRTHQRFWGDPRNHRRILPSEAPVGRQKLRLLHRHNPALDRLSSPVNLTTLHPCWRKTPNPYYRPPEEDRQRHLRHPATTNPSPRPSPSPMDPMAKRRPPSRRRYKLMAQRRSSSLPRAPRLSRPRMPIRTATARWRRGTGTNL